MFSFHSLKFNNSKYVIVTKNVINFYNQDVSLAKEFATE